MINSLSNELTLDIEDTREATDVPNRTLFQSINNEFLSMRTTNSVADCLKKASE